MSNPTLLTENFNGSLGAFAGVDPIRYDSGLWIEEATTNYVTNPVAGVGTTGWFPGTNIAITRETTLPGPLPSWVSGAVTAVFKATATGTITGDTMVAIGGSSVPLAGSYMASALVWVEAGVTATALNVKAYNFVGATVAEGAINLSKRDQWQSVASQSDIVIGDLNGHTGIQIKSGSMLVGQAIWFVCVGLQPGTHETSAAAGSFGTGYAWNGTVHNSASTRAASSASVTTAEPAAVACWYREAYSGAKSFAYIEPYGTLGTYGSIAWSGGTLTLSTSRNLVVGPFAAFDRELTANEQANLRSTQNWSMNSVNGSNIILPLSGRRRPR